MKFAMGGEQASLEAERTVMEKITVVQSAAATAMTGGSAENVVLAYRKKCVRMRAVYPSRMPAISTMFRRDFARYFSPVDLWRLPARPSRPV
jgi:hypothetical protein